MFKVRVIPCLDVKDGRVVKGVNFVNLRDAGDPVEAAIAYDEGRRRRTDLPRHHREPREPRHHARRGAAHGRGLLHAAHRRRRRAHHRGHPRAADLRRRQGVDQHRGGDAPRFVKEAAEKFGDQCIVVAIDAKKVSKPGEAERWEIFTHGGRNPTGIDARRLCRAKWSRSAPARSCLPRWIATARGKALTSRSPALSRTPCRCR